MVSIVVKEYDISVLHIGSGGYRPFDKSHSTYAIWRELSSGFKKYDVIGRGIGASAKWTDGLLTVHLLRQRMAREIEFLWTQFLVVPLGCRLKPNAIVCQSPVGGGLAALCIAKITGAGVLMEIHGNEYLMPSAIGSRNWFIQMLSQYALNRATLIRVLSEGMREHFLNRYGEHLADRIRVLPPRVDLERFPFKVRHQSMQGALRLIMVGAVNENKGQLRLIEALRETPIKIEIHIVGDGPDLAECRARQSTDSLKIHCHGRLTHEVLSDLMAKVDVFVMYSLSEGTPRAIMEAMATGLPVVTTNAGFCADIVRHGEEGIVLGSDPDKEILSVLVQLKFDPVMARNMGVAAQARAERDYDAAILYERYRSLIAELAS